MQNYENPYYDDEARHEERAAKEDRRQRRHEYECRTFGTEIPTLGISIPALPPDGRPEPVTLTFDPDWMQKKRDLGDHLARLDAYGVRDPDEEGHCSLTPDSPCGTSGFEAENRP